MILDTAAVWVTAKPGSLDLLEGMRAAWLSFSKPLICPSKTELVFVVCKEEPCLTQVDSSVSTFKGREKNVIVYLTAMTYPPNA